ncbi:hypothetical protein Godav_019841, partial [Gossypium davidsonii]|nr:hypothetical protein [Gossypium davidsonii]
MRDQEGRWILAYNWYLGFCFVMEAELWGILDRLTLILEWIYDFLIIQTDSVEAVQAIQEHARKDLELTLIRRIHQLLSRIGHWVIWHIPREDNGEANGTNSREER